jgi:pilus assembly protein CpaB
MAALRGVSFRVLAIVLAIVLAAVATLAITSYLDSLEAEREAELQPVEAFVAAQRIPEGTTGEQAVAQNLIERREIPQNVVAPGAISSLSQLEGRVAAVDILPGEQIISARFVEPQAARGLAPIPDDMQAISLEVGIPPGVAGFIQPGDRVSIIARLDVGDPDEQAEQTEEGAEAGEGARVQFLLQGVEVLAIGQRVIVQQQDGGEQSQVNRGEGRVLMTVALSPVDAEKLAYAIFEGQLYFTLLPEDQEFPVDTPGRTRDNAFE